MKNRNEKGTLKSFLVMQTLIIAYVLLNSIIPYMTFHILFTTGALLSVGLWLGYLATKFKYKE